MSIILRWALVRVRPFLTSILLGPLLVLGGCASFDGSPAPVLAISDVANSPGITVQTALTNFYYPNNSVRNNLSPEGYRNMIIGTYLMAADVRFNEFRRQLSRQSRGSQFGLDVGILGFAGGAAISTGQRTANVLAAIASGLTGTRSALNRDVYFDRTLPALMASMEAARTRVRTTIMVKMRQSAEDYPLPVALADVASYESAASLDSAIEALAADASTRANAAQRTYAAEVLQYTGAPDEGVSAIRVRIRQKLVELSGANTPESIATLRQMATSAGLTPPAGATASDIRHMIQEKVDSVDSIAGTRQLATSLGVSLGEQQ